MSAGDVSNSEFVGSLYRDHRGWLLAWLNRNLGCRQRAEDLSQDTFVRLLGRPELPGLREPRAFLAKVARGLMIDHFRRAALEQAYLAELALVPEAEQPSAEEQYLILEDLREIDRLLGTLSLKARSAFLYSRLDGMPTRRSPSVSESRCRACANTWPRVCASATSPSTESPGERR